MRPFQPSIEGKKLHLAVRIAQVESDKPSADQPHRLQRGIALGNDLLPVRLFGTMGIHGDQAPARGVQIGQEIKNAPLIPGEVVAGIEIVQYGGHHGARPGQFL